MSSETAFQLCSQDCFEEAAVELDKIIEKYKGISNIPNLSTLRCAAKVFEKMGRSEDAKKSYQTFLSKQKIANAETSQVEFDFGNLLQIQGDIDAAKVLFAKSLRSNPKNDKAHFQLGIILFQLGQYQEAVIHMKKHIELDPSSAYGRYNFVIFLRKLRESDSDVGLFDPHNAEIIDHLTKAVETQQRFEQARYALAVSLYKTKMFERSAECWKVLIQQEPILARNHFNLALCYIALDQMEDALKSLQTAAQFSDNDPRVQNTLGEISRKLGKVEESLEYYKKATEIDPNCAKYLLNLALAEKQLAHFSQASIYLKNALVIDPHNPHSRFHFADCLMEMQRFEEAKEIFHLLEMSDCVPKELNIEQKLREIDSNLHS